MNSYGKGGDVSIERTFLKIKRLYEGNTMKKLFFILMLSVLMVGLPTIAQDGANCDIDAPAEQTEINMIGWSFAITDFYAEELQACNDVDNLVVNANLLASTDALEQVRLALSTGGDSPFEIVHGANGEVGDWGSQGWLLPLNDLIEQYREEYNLDDIPETVWEVGTLDGNIYGIPIVSNTLHTIYRTDVFEELGLVPPETYEDVINICNEIGIDNTDWDMPFYIDLSRPRGWELEFFMVLRALGGDYLDENNMPIFNDEEGLEAVELMVEVAEACIGPDGFALSLNDAEVGMQLGTIPSTKIWASRAANMSDPERTDPELLDFISYAPAPRVTEDGPRAGSAWNDFYFIPANVTVDPELIFQVIMEAVDMESQQRAAAIGSPTRVSSSDFGGSYLPAANQTIAEGIGNYDKNPAINIVIAKLSEFLPLVATGDLTPQEALDAAADAYIEEATAQGYITN